MISNLARQLVLCLGLWVAAAPASAAPAFADWSAVVVAGDWHDHDGGPSEGFDNARRDVALALQGAGFQAANMRQFSVRPERYTPTPDKSEPNAIHGALRGLTAKASGGCLLYFTSHGVRQGMIVDDRVLRPSALAGMIDTTCGSRPTVVVISACFSGVFINDLAKPNRMILTAARPDRSSFGCGQADKYPYFDDCFLQVMPRAQEFVGLAREIRACVAGREAVEGMRPPSEPQVWIGPALAPLLPLYGFQTPPAPPRS